MHNEDRTKEGRESIQLDCPACAFPIVALAKGDDGISRCPNCGCHAKEALVIRVIDIPEWSAPYAIKKTWVGMELLAELFQGYGINFRTGRSLGNGKAFLVPKDFALEALGAKFPKAARWFYRNVPYRLEHLTFGIDEVELVGKIAVFDFEP